MLVISSDTYPAARVDVSVLFGEELSARGHRFDWILQSEAACARPYETAWANGRVFVGSTDLGDSIFHRIRKHLRGIRNDLRLFGLLRRGHYDLVEVKDKFLSAIAVLIAARLTRVRFVFWLSYPLAEEYLTKLRDGKARYPLLYALRGSFSWVLLYKLILPAARHVFVQSEQMKRDVAKQGIPLEKMTAVPMGVKASLLAELPRATSRTVIPEHERCILYLGTLNAVRHLDFLVRVLGRVREGRPDVKLYFVGRGDHPADEELLIKEAARLGLTDAVVITGQLPQSTALQYVREADVCVSPFYPTPVLISASPTKLVEYMAMGKAVVANDHPEQRLVIDESRAGYCVPWEETAFADAIVQLLDDPQEAEAMGLRGRQYVLEHRSYQRIADVVEERLLQIAGVG